MMSKSSMKSARCIGRSCSSAARRSASVSARIISRITVMRSASKNMCSLRQRPRPSTRNSRAMRASAGVSALARTPRSRAASAQSRSSEKAPPSSGGIMAGAPAITSPRVPSTVISAPSRRMRPSGVISARAAVSMRSSLAPTTQGRPRPRAITAAWLDMPPRTVSTPRAACMPRMSSGLVSRRTRIVASSWAAAAWAASAVKTTWPVAAPGLAARPLAKTSRGAAGSICGWRCSIRLRGSMRSRASLRVMAPAWTRSTAMRTAARPVRRTGTASRIDDLAVFHREFKLIARRRARGRAASAAASSAASAARPSSSSGRTSWAPRRAPLPWACGRKSPARPGAPVRLLTGCMWPEPQTPGPRPSASRWITRPSPAASGAPLAWRRMRAEAPAQARAMARAAASSCAAGSCGQGSPVSSSKNAIISATCAGRSPGWRRTAGVEVLRVEAVDGVGEGGDEAAVEAEGGGGADALGEERRRSGR